MPGTLASSRPSAPACGPLSTKPPRAVSRRSPEPTRRVCRLDTIPGIGSLLGLTIATEIGEVARFQSSRKLVGYAGRAPGIITTHVPRKAAQLPRARPGPVVDAPHPVDRRPRADTGESEELGDETEPPASGRERRSETCAAGDAIPRRGDPWFNQPRRTQTSRARSCPRIRCRGHRSTTASPPPS
jgi:hypothetical protein